MVLVVPAKKTNSGSLTKFNLVYLQYLLNSGEIFQQVNLSISSLS